MKNKIPVIAVVLGMIFISSCKIAGPAFKTIQNVEFQGIGKKGLKLGTEAVFNNPNKLKFRITDIDLNVVLDNRLIGTLGEKTDILIKKKSDFILPVSFNIKPEGTILDNLKTLWNI
ncbi:MAG: hypothetical protein JWO06_1679, partial [Bacteroidota bacterium]|nr:hypothetical protein [Bacteroidota bacterium]